MKRITLPVTPEGNDPADYAPDTLDALNAEIDQRATAIGTRQAEAYLLLFDQLKARLALRGSDTITCQITLAYRDKCLAALGRR